MLKFFVNLSTKSLFGQIIFKKLNAFPINHKFKLNDNSVMIFFKEVYETFFLFKRLMNWEHCHEIFTLI